MLEYIELKDEKPTKLLTLGICVVAFLLLPCVLASHYANTMLNAVVFLCVLKYYYREFVFCVEISIFAS